MAVMPYSPRLGAKYIILGGDGSRAVLNDPSDADHVGAVVELTGLDSAEIRENAQDLVEAHGGVHGNFYFGRRPITMKIKVFEHTSLRDRDVKIDKFMRATAAALNDGNLSWIPADAVQNLVTNPRAGVDTAGVHSIQGGFTVVRITSGVPAGLATGYEFAGTASATSGAFRTGFTGTGVGGFPVTPNTPYAWRGDAQLAALSSGTVSTMRLVVRWFQASGAASAITASSAGVNSVTPVVGTDYVLTGTATSPADAAFATIDFVTVNTNPSTYTSRFTGVSLVKGTVVPSYFDGSTSGYYWQGTPHNSPSTDYIQMRSLFRRQQPTRVTGNYNKDVEAMLVSERAFLESYWLSTATSTAGGALPQDITLENRGNAGALPERIRVYGPVTDPVIASLTTGNTIVGMTGTIANGDFWDINVKDHTVIANNGDDKYSNVLFPQSTWQGLLSGSNQVRLEGTAGGAATKFWVDWRDAWV